MAKDWFGSDLEHQTEEQTVSHNQATGDSYSRSRSSCVEVAAAVDLANASARVRRDSRLQSWGGSSQSLVPILANQTKRVLSELILIPTEVSRPSVIVTPRTSTPIVSPSETASFQSHSDISVVEEVFEPFSVFDNWNNSCLSMEAAEREILKKHNALLSLMAFFNANNLNEATIHLFDTKRNNLEDKAISVYADIGALFIDFQDQILPQKSQQWKDFDERLKKEVYMHLNALDLKATELKRVQSEIMNQGINASLQDVLSKQNELTAKIHSEATKEKNDRAAESRKEEDAKKKTSISKARLKLNKVKSDLDDLEEESSEIPLDE